MSFIRWAAHFSHMILPVAAIGLLAAGPLTAAGQGAYPNRPVKIVVPISPGSGTDVVARMVAERLIPFPFQSDRSLHLLAVLKHCLRRYAYSPIEMETE